MLMNRIRNWLKLLALWAWVHFITLLASDPDSVPKLKYVKEEDEIIILADETSDVDKIKRKKKKKKLSNDLEEGNEEELPNNLLEEKEEDYLGNEEISTEENEGKLSEEEILEKSQLEDEEEKEDNDEEDEIPWLGVGRGTGLTRYSGIQNLLDTTNVPEEPIVIERRQPVLIPRRDGPLVLQRPSFGRSLSHEKERLSEIPEEEKQSPPSFNDDVSNDSDKLWASLVARYGKEEENVNINIGKEISRFNDRNSDAEAVQQSIFTSPEESISSEEFSNQVEERLQRYLSKIDEQKILNENFTEDEVLPNETGMQDKETREFDEYEVDTEIFDENGRLSKGNKIFILIEDDDSNEEKEENVDRKYGKEIMSNDNFGDVKFEIESMDGYRLKSINEEEEAISDYDDLQFDSSSILIDKADVPVENITKPSTIILDSELISTTENDNLGAEDFSDSYYKYQEDGYSENASEDEDVIEEEKTAVLTISLYKKPETSKVIKSEDDFSTLIKTSVIDHESSQIVDDKNETNLTNSGKEGESIEIADKKIDISSEFLKERRPSRDLWKMDCEKFLGEQESPQNHSLEERDDFIFTTYDEFPEDCVPVAEGLLAISEKFGIPVDVETPIDEEEDSIVDSVFEEPKAQLGIEDFNVMCSIVDSVFEESKIHEEHQEFDMFTESVHDETTNTFRNEDSVTFDKQTDTGIIANLDNKCEASKVTDLPDVAEADKLFTTVEETHPMSIIASESQIINDDQNNIEDKNIEILDACALKSMDDNVKVGDTVDYKIKSILKSNYEVELIQENGSSANKGGTDYTDDHVDNDICTNRTYDTEDAPSSGNWLKNFVKEEPVLDVKHHRSCNLDMNVSMLETTQDLRLSILKEHAESKLDDSMELETVEKSKPIQILEVKEEPVLDIKFHGICDIDVANASLETTENLRYPNLEEHAESKLDDSMEMETVKESKHIQILEQMVEETPKENNFEANNSDTFVVLTEKEKNGFCFENRGDEISKNELINENVKETSKDKGSLSNVSPVIETPADICFKSSETFSELPSNDKKKKIVAKVKKGKLDNILKRFEEKEPISKTPLPKKKIVVKAKETKPSTEGIENAQDKPSTEGIENDQAKPSLEQEDTLISSVISTKKETADEITPIAMDVVTSVEAFTEETSVIIQNKDILQTDIPLQQMRIKECISDILTSQENFINKEIFSTENVAGYVKDIACDEKSSENQSVTVNELAKDSFNTPETEKLEQVNLPSSINEKIGTSEKKEFSKTNEGNFELSLNQTDKGLIETAPLETKAEIAESVIVEPTSVNVVTITIPKRKKLLLPKKFEEISEPKQMVKTAVKKGKLDNILKKFEEKESSTKASSKSESSSKMSSVVKSKDLEESSTSQLSKEVQADELKTSVSVQESSFSVKDCNNEMDNMLSEKPTSVIAEGEHEPIRYNKDNLNTMKKCMQDFNKESLENSLLVLDNEQVSMIKFKKETKSTAYISSVADTQFVEKNLEETCLELNRSDKSLDEKDGCRSNFNVHTTVLSKEKSTSLLDLRTEKLQEQITDEDESCYLLDKIIQETPLKVEDIDTEKEKSSWFDSSENLREAKSLSERRTSEGAEQSYWFEEDSKQEGKTSSFWFEEDETNKVHDEAAPNEINVGHLSDETLRGTDNIETKKQHSYFSEDDDDVYFLKKVEEEKEKPFTEEKDEELALLRKETMELSKPKKIRKDSEDSEFITEKTFTRILKSSEISEEDRLEKERILSEIRNERDMSKSGLIPEGEIPEYLDDVKDLLVPKARRRKGRSSKVLDDLMNLDEPDFSPKASAISKNELRYERPLANAEFIGAQRPNLDTEDAEKVIKKESKPISNKFLTLEEESELIEIQREQEALRASQRKELEKYLSMPAALTEQEQQELEELLAEEENDKTVNAISEARLEALLNEVRKRIGDSELDLETAAALEEYIGLPIGLTEEEELLLSNVGEEKDRSQFASDEEYREYIKQRYLDELEDERMRVEEDEYEFGGNYEDDYEYDGDEDYDEEYMEEDYDMMEGDNIPHTVIMKDEAVGGDEPMDLEIGETDNVELKKKKNLLTSLSSLHSKGSKSSSGSLDKQGSNYSSKDGSSADLPNESSHTQSKKFFRLGGLSIKRKKKSKNYSQIDPGIIIDGPNVRGLSKNIHCKLDNLKNVFDILNNDELSTSFSAENMSNINESSSCDHDEKFVVISNNICKSITNLSGEETIPTCQDFPAEKINSTTSDFKSSLLNERNINELRSQNSKNFNKGTSFFSDPTYLALLLPECEREENESQSNVCKITEHTTTTDEGCSSSTNHSSLSESWEAIDYKDRECLKPSKCEIPNILITDVSNITTKIFSLLKQKTDHQRNISPLNQIQNTMSIPSKVDLNTNEPTLQYDRKCDEVEISGTTSSDLDKCLTPEPLEILDNYYSLSNEKLCNTKTPSGKSCLIREAKMKG